MAGRGQVLAGRGQDVPKWVWSLDSVTFRGHFLDLEAVLPIKTGVDPGPWIWSDSEASGGSGRRSWDTLR